MTDQDRRAALKTFAGLGLGAAALVAAPKRSVAQDQKVAQEVVQYQEMPKDGAECDKCVNWVAPNACAIVAGKINPKGWCVAYAPKEG
ncbi:MAG: high-potential iron-sulfur protein [Acetobacteraceae bacterium]|nr:high-potential iron-sulfur protein [Acetobacteraceae bacterium]